VESVFFVGLLTPGLENLGLQTLTSTPRLKNVDSNSDSGPKIILRHYDLLGDLMIVYLRIT